MAFGETWNENIPNDNTLAKNIDDEVRSTKTAIRERLEVEHDFAADESGITTIGQHKKGSARVGFGTAEEKPANNADNPGLLYLTLADVDADEEVTQLEITKVELDTGTEWKTLAGINWNIYEADGTTVKTSTTATNATHGVKAFTSTGTFVVPAGITTVWVTICGGGGGGGGAVGGSGGGADAKIAQPVTGLTPGEEIAITIGAKGKGGVSGGASATAGGTSSFGSFVSASGGGKGNNASGSGGAAGGPGGAKGNTSTAAMGANGGGSMFGAGGIGGTGAGGDAGGYGAGGAGGASASNGGDGSPGFVLVEW
jgi:hypothetical protein